MYISSNCRQLFNHRGVTLVVRLYKMYAILSWVEKFLLRFAMTLATKLIIYSLENRLLSKKISVFFFLTVERVLFYLFIY